MSNGRSSDPYSDTFKRDVGARLRLVRLALGLQAVQLSAELGAAPPRWSQWEHGRHLADLRVMVRLARRYGVPLDFLYLGSESAVPKKLFDAMREVRRNNTNP
jgi:transcriptional regulator with XRE-family HTH domain